MIPSESQIERFEAPQNAFGPRFFRPYPALLGRQVNWGFRQSTPSSMQAICEAEIETTPSFAEGQMNFPRSSLLA